jgi:hypothetical protein
LAVLPTNSVNRAIRQAVDGFSAQQRRAPLGRGSLAAIGGMFVVVGAWLTWVLVDNDPEWRIGVALMVLGVPVAAYGSVHFLRQRELLRQVAARIEAEQRLPVVGNFTRSNPRPTGPNPGHAARRLRARCPNARLRRRWQGHLR